MHPLQQRFPFGNPHAEELYALVQNDWELGHRQASYTPMFMLQSLSVWLAAGNFVSRHGKVLFLGRPLSEEVFEFHPINGGSVRGLLRALSEFLSALLEFFPVAVSTYDNPRVQGLADHMPFPYKVVEAEDSPHFTITLNLRSR